LSVPSVLCGACKAKLMEDPHLPADKRLPCPSCGSVSRHFDMKMAVQGPPGTVQMSEKATDKNNNIKAERINTNNGHIVSSMEHDARSPALVQSERSSKPVGKEENLKAKNKEERTAAFALCRAYNQKNKTNFEAECKESVDGNFEDAWLAEGTQRLPIQICHFDTELLASLVTTGATVTQTIDCTKLTKMIEKAVQSKAKRYALAEKASCILLLQVPYGLGQSIREELQQRTFDFGGFIEVWISPLHEDCFDLCKVERLRLAIDDD